MDEAASTSDLGLELHRYARILARQRAWVIGTTVVVLLCTLVLTQVQQRGAVSQESVAVPQESASPRSPSQGQTTNGIETRQITRILIEPATSDRPVDEVASGDVVTHAQLIAANQTARAVIRRLGLQLDEASLLEGLTVSAVPGSRVLTIAYEGDATDSGRNVAVEFAQAYLSTLEKQDRQRLERQIQLLKTQSRIIRNRLLATTGDVTRAAILGRLIKVQEELSEIEATVASIDRGRLVGPPIAAPTATPDAATVTPAPGEISASQPPSLARNELVGLFLGLLLGLTVGLTRETLDNRLRTRRMVERALRLPVLLVHPDVPDEEDVSLERAYSILERMTRPSTTVVVTGFATSEELSATARLLSDAARGSRNVADETTAVDDNRRAELSIVPAPPLLESSEGTRLAAGDQARMVLVIDGATARLPEVIPVLAELRVGGIEPLGVLLYRGEEY